MTERAGGDLLDRRLAARQTLRVIFRGEIAGERGDPIVGPKRSGAFFCRLQICCRAIVPEINQG